MTQSQLSTHGLHTPYLPLTATSLLSAIGFELLFHRRRNHRLRQPIIPLRWLPGDMRCCSTTMRVEAVADVEARLLGDRATLCHYGKISSLLDSSRNTVWEAEETPWLHAGENGVQQGPTVLTDRLVQVDSRNSSGAHRSRGGAIEAHHVLVRARVAQHRAGDPEQEFGFRLGRPCLEAGADLRDLRRVLKVSADCSVRTLEKLNRYHETTL